jgi:polyisoprenoid-binding protein YceI
MLSCTMLVQLKSVLDSCLLSHEEFMKRLFYLILLAGLVLSACAVQPAATSAPASAPTSTPNADPTQAAYPAVLASQPTSQAYPAATSENTSGITTSDTVTFKIVPSKSQASYTVNETFLNENNRLNTAVGVTTQVSGEIYTSKANPPKSSLGTISIELSKLASDSSRRDNMIRQNFLESSKFPLAKFVPDKYIGLPASYQEGQDYSFKVSGNLKVHNVTKPVSFDVSANLTGDTLNGTATTTLLMSDFGVGPISLMGMLKTEDKVGVKLTFVPNRTGS